MICTHIIIAIVAASHLAAHDASDVRFDKQIISKELTRLKYLSGTEKL